VPAFVPVDPALPAAPLAPTIEPLLVILSVEPKPHPVPDNKDAVPDEDEEIVTPELMVRLTVPVPPNPADVAIE
jgi:hypothetical protein